MASVIVAAVEAVRSLLETDSDTGMFMFRFQPARDYIADLSLHEDSDLHVDVKHAPNEIKTETDDRGCVVYTIPVLVCVRKRLGDPDKGPDGLPSQSDLDQLTEFTEQICEHFAMARLLAGDTVCTEPGEIASVAPQDELKQRSLFFSGVRVVCRVVKEL